MKNSQKKSSNISGFVKKFFASPKSPAKNLALFAVLTVLVMGFSANDSLAAPTILAPGAVITPGSEFQQMIANGANIPKGYEKYNDQMQQLVANGKMPTSPGDWGAVLKYYGGYSRDQVDQAGIQYANQFVPSSIFGHGLTGLFGYLNGTNMSDQQMLDYWKKGQNIPTPSTVQKVAASAQLPIASAETSFKDWATGKVWEVVVGVLQIIAWFCKQLVYYSAQALDLTLRPGLYNFANSKMVVQGWTVVRDVCNLFFLLVLLFIALCTILKIEKYHAKKTLLTLIIMALLINFSKPITVFVFDGSQLLMNFFLNQMNQTGTGQETSSIMMNASDTTKLVYESLPNSNSIGAGQSGAAIAVQYLFAVVFLFMMGVAFLVMFAFLLIRIVAIMMLIIVSPFAFFAAIVPDLSNMSTKWWKALFEYSYYGPAAAFFLLLATNLGTLLPSVTDTKGGQSTEATISNILHYTTTLIFLYASIFMAKQFGGGAGAAIVGNANRFMKWAPKAPFLGMRGAYRMSGAHEPMTNWMKEKFPNLHRIATKEGRKEGSRKFWEEKVFRTKKGEQKAVADATKKMKDANFTEGDYKDTLDKAASSAERMAAALELAKMGKLDLSQYEKAIKDFQKNPSFKKFFDSEVKKKNVHVTIDSEISQEEQKLGRTLTSDERQTIYDKHLGSIKPTDIAEQNVGQLMSRQEFREFANATYSTMAPSIKNDLAKKLSAEDLYNFDVMGWV